MGNLQTLHGVGDPVEYLKRNLNVEVGKKDDIITVSLEARDAGEAARVVNAAVHAYVTYQNKAHHSTSGEVLQILQKEKVAMTAIWRPSKLR